MKVFRFKIFGHDYESKVVRRDDDEIVFSVNGQEYKAYLQPSKKKQFVKPTPKMNRPVAVPQAGTKVTAEPTGSKGAGAVKSPMPGLIIKINVRVGDEVKIGQTVAILEAMKMENAIQAPKDGKVSGIQVHEGDSVIEGQDIVIID